MVDCISLKGHVMSVYLCKPVTNQTRNTDSSVKCEVWIGSKMVNFKHFITDVSWCIHFNSSDLTAGLEWAEAEASTAGSNDRVGGVVPGQDWGEGEGSRGAEAMAGGRLGPGHTAETGRAGEEGRSLIV